MHVVYIHQYFTTPDQKGGTRSYEMARRLIQAGHQVTMVGGTTDLIGMDGSPGDVQAETIDGINVLRILEPYSNAMSFGRRWIAFLKFARKAYKVIKTLKDVDVVFATSTPLTTGDPGRKGARFHKCPFIFEVRDLWPELPIAMGLVGNPLLRWYLKRMELRAYKAAARVIGLAPGIKKGICQTGYPEQHVAMIPNSSDVDLFMPATSKEQVDNDPRFGKPGDFRLAFTGGLGPGQGVVIQVQHIQQVLRPTFCLQARQHAPRQHLHRRHRAPHAVVQAAPVININIFRRLNLIPAGPTDQDAVISTGIWGRRHFIYPKAVCGSA